MNETVDRRLDEIQADIERTRTDLNQTLNAIEQRLNPSELFDRGFDYVRHSGAREYVVNLGAAARQDPLPLALVGVGLAWLMMSSRDGSRVDRVHVGSPGPSADELTSGIRDTATGVRDSVSDAVSSVKGAVASMRDKVSSVRDSAARTTQKISGTTQRIGQTAQAARDKASQMGNAAREQADRMRSGIDRLVNEQPLALGAIGLAVGAVLAASAPRTRQEDRFMGDTSDRVKDDVKQAGEEQLDRVQSSLRASRANSGFDAGRPVDVGAETSTSSEPPPAVVTALPPGPR